MFIVVRVFLLSEEVEEIIEEVRCGVNITADGSKAKGIGGGLEEGAILEVESQYANLKMAVRER